LLLVTCSMLGDRCWLNTVEAVHVKALGMQFAHPESGIS